MATLKEYLDVFVYGVPPRSSPTPPTFPYGPKMPGPAREKAERETEQAVAARQAQAEARSKGSILDPQFWLDFWAGVSADLRAAGIYVVFGIVALLGVLFLLLGAREK